MLHLPSCAVVLYLWPGLLFCPDLHVPLSNCLQNNSLGYLTDISNLTCPKLNFWLSPNLFHTQPSHLSQWQLQPSGCSGLKTWTHPCLLTFFHILYLVHQQTSLSFLWNIAGIYFLPHLLQLLLTNQLKLLSSLTRINTKASLLTSLLPLSSLSV